MIYVSTNLPNLIAVSYLLAFLTRHGGLLDTYWATKHMPRGQVVLCTIPHVQFALQRILVSVLRIVRRGTATVL